VSLLTSGGSGTVQRLREEYVVHFPHYDKDALGPASAILLGDYKLIRVYETGQRLLFDLAQDPGERRDLASQLPDKVRDLDARLTTYLQTVNAQLPTLNATSFRVPIRSRSRPEVSPRRQGGQGRKTPQRIHAEITCAIRPSVKLVPQRSK